MLRSEGFGGYYRYFAGLPFCMVTKGFFSHIFILHCVFMGLMNLFFRKDRARAGIPVRKNRKRSARGQSLFTAIGFLSM